MEQQFLEKFDQNDSLIKLALSAYDRPHTKTIEEFVDDYSRFRYVKRLLNKANTKPRLVLNHLILLFNVFDREAVVKILFENNKESLHVELKTYLFFLNQINIEKNEDIDYNLLQELKAL